MRSPKMLPVLAATLLAWLASAPAADAYLDPGTGSALIQIVVATVMGALFILKVYWRKLVSFFGGGAPEDDGPAPAQSTARDEDDRR